MTQQKKKLLDGYTKVILICFVVGLAFLLLAGLSIRQSVASRNFDQVSGTVTRIYGLDKRSHKADVSYSYEGRMYSRSDSIVSRSTNVGDPVFLVVDPKNPAHSEMNRGAQFVAVAINVGIGLSALGLGTYLYVHQKRNA